VSGRTISIQILFPNEILFKMDETNEHLLKLWKETEEIADIGKKAIYSMPQNIPFSSPFLETSLSLSTDMPANSLNSDQNDNVKLSVIPKPRLDLPIATSLIVLTLSITSYLLAATALSFIFAFCLIPLSIITLKALWVRLNSNN
jgi:hypothetical protein